MFDHAGERRAELEAAGATFDSRTNQDYTCFSETLPADSVEAGLELEAERMAAPGIDRSRFEAALGRLRRQRRQQLEANPFEAALERLYATAFAGHPYAAPVIGSDQDLARITLDDLEAYHRERYAPQNAVLAVVGRFDPQTTLAAIHRRFDRLPRRSGGRSAEARMPPPRATSRVFLTAPIQGQLVLVGWRGPGDSDPDNPALELIASVLSAGSPSRLTRKLVTGDGDFIGVRAEFDRSRDASLLVCAAILKPGGQPAPAEEALISAVEDLARETLAGADLERAQRQVEMETFTDWQTSHGRAQGLGTAVVLDDDYRAAAGRLDRIGRLTVDDLRRAAAKALRTETRSVVWLAPPGSPLGPPVPSTRGVER
jgi:zinc protease